LFDIGASLADKVRVATTSLKNPPNQIGRWWVQAGNPLVLVEAPFSQAFIDALDPPLNTDAMLAKEGESIALHHFSYIDFHQQRIPVWTLFYNREIDVQALRLLRIHLWRLHNEREVLKLVLAACLQGRLQPSQVALRDYLARQSARLRQASSEGMPQADLLSHAYALDALVNKDDIGLLIELLHNVSPGLAASVTPLTNSITAPAQAIFIVNGTVQVAQHIDNSHSQTIQSVGSVGAVIGGEATVSGGNFQGRGVQDIRILDGVNMPQLATELQRLAEELTKLAKSAEEETAARQIAEAEAAAHLGDKNSVWTHLAHAGRWALSISTQIGVGVAAAVIAAAIAA
jgi:hypothetical protein